MRFKPLIIATMCVAWVGTAHATTGVLITASGIWGDNAPVTAISAPDTAWTLSFLEPDPLQSDPGTIVGMGWATAFSQSFEYTLGGTSTSSAFSQAIFYDAANGGGVDVSFNSSADTLSLYSDSDTAYTDEDTGTVISTPFSDSITESYNDNQASQGEGALSITSENFTLVNPNNPVSPVPEPKSWALLLSGLGLVGAMLRLQSSQERARRIMVG